MEVMTKEEYFKGMLCELLANYRALDERVKMLNTDCCEESAAAQTDVDIAHIFRLTADNDYELGCILQKRFDDAYDAYVENSEKDHIFDVEFHYTVYGKAQVHAKDEDEAREYVVDELYLDGDSVYFCNDDRVVEEPSCDVSYGGIELDSVDDTGDEFDED